MITLKLALTLLSTSALSSGVVNPFANAAAAFSMRIPAGSTYTGPLVRVRRSSDNAEADIGAVATADANGNRWLDEGALLNWLGVPSRPLDAVTGAAAAFSLRKVRSAYTGAAIRVRRSSDSVEQDIGFTTNGGLDTVTLLTFVGAGSGFITTWYDQSGNGRNVVQATAANQPRIVNAGVAEAVNGKLSVFFNGAQWLESNAPLTTTNTFVVLANTAYTSPANVEYTTGLNGLGGLRSSLVERRVGLSLNMTNFVDNIELNVLRQYTDTRNPNSMRRNGVDVFAGGVATSSSGTNFQIGARDGSLTMIGYESELLFFTETVSNTNRLAIEQSQAVYYGITYASAIPSAFVTTWYDQSGNGRNAVQASSGLQPRIVNAGLVNLKNGKPSLFFSGSSWLIGAAALNAQQAFMVQATNSTAFSFEYSCGSIVPSLAAIRSDASFRRAGRAGTTNELGQFIDDANLGVMRQYTDSIEASGSAMRRNGLGVNRDSVVSSTQGNLLTIGSRDGVTASIVADISELVFFQNVLAAPARQALERSQGTAFGITVA